MKKRRSFGGKIYIHRVTKKTTTDAEQIARIHRSTGLNSRVVKTDGGYSVYSRKRKR